MTLTSAMHGTCRMRIILGGPLHGTVCNGGKLGVQDRSWALELLTLRSPGVSTWGPHRGGRAHDSPASRSVGEPGD